jgi:hypothetical protein
MAASRASSEARDVLHQAMCPALYRHIPMAIEIASKVGVLFCIIDFIVLHNLRQRPGYGPYKIKLR